MLVNEIRKISEENSYKLIREDVYNAIKEEAEKGNYLCVIEENDLDDNKLTETDMEDIQAQGFRMSLQTKEQWGIKIRTYTILW